MLKGVFLDFDGVVIDTEWMHYQVYREYFSKLDFELKIEDYLVCVGSNYLALIKHLNEKYNLSINSEEFLVETEEKMLEATNELPLINGVGEAIRSIKDNGLMLFVSSSSNLSKIEFHLKRLDIYDYFDGFITGNMVSNLKPAPDIYNKALEVSGLNRDEVIIIEDSENGLKAGRNAGIEVIVVFNRITKHSDFSGAFKIFNNISDIDFKILKERLNA